MGVGGPDDFPRLLERDRRCHSTPSNGRRIERCGHNLGKGAIRIGGGPHTGALAPDHGGHPRQQVPEIVGEICVVPGHHPLIGEVPVGPERLIAQEVIAIPVDTEILDQVGRSDLVESGLRHLLATHRQKTVNEDVRRWLDAGAHQHRRPIHTVEAEDVLADDVGGGPHVCESGRIIGEPCGREVVGQRVEPHIGHMVFVPRKRNPPVDRCATDREITQPLPDETESLIASNLRQDEIVMGFVPIEQRLLVTTQLEEVVLLTHLDDLAALSLQLRDLGRSHVGLIGDRVEALVMAQIDIAVGVTPLQQFSHRRMVARLGRSDEIVVGNVELIPALLEPDDRAVGPLLGGNPIRFGRLLDLEPVLVGPGEEESALPQQPVPARQRIGGDGGVGVPDVWRIVYVVDGCGEVTHGHRAA